MIRIRALSKRYPGNKEDTLKKISCTFPDTGLVYLIGKSGSGKSTLLHLLGGMDSEYEGSLQVNGCELKDMTEEEKADYRFQMVSFVFQSFKADEEENVETNLRKPFLIMDISKEEQEQRIDMELRKVGLSEKRRQHFKDLSGGEKKRISLVRGLLKETPILLADEPVASLNQGLRKEITSLLLKESTKRLVIVITHETEEIPKEATIYQIENGHLFPIQTKQEQNKPQKRNPPQRKPFRGLPLLQSMWHMLTTQKEFLMITVLTFAMALFSISFSFQLSGGVSSALMDSFASFMEDDSMVVTNQDNGYIGTGFETADYQEIHYLSRKYPEMILSEATFYTTSLDEIFLSGQSFSVTYQNASLPLRKISLNSFLEFRMPEESSSQIIYGQNSDLENEEVILGLDEETMVGLYYLIFEEQPKFLDDTNLKKIGDALKYRNLSLNMILQKTDWKYHLEHSFLIKGVTLASSCFIVSTIPDFNTHFVTQILHFKEALEEEETDPDVPWTLKKCEGFRLYPEKVSAFLRLFLYEKSADPYVLKVLENPLYYETNRKETHNHVVLYRDYLPKVSLSELSPFIQDHQENLSSVSYSSPVYTYTASGYISGFQKPFFFSKRKEKLNYIEDSAQTSERDLGAFQGSLIEVPEDVIKADLVSSMEEGGLRFVSLDVETQQPCYGVVPSDDEGIGISTAMAKKLFGTASLALGKTIHTLTLDETRKTANGYQNLFSEGSLTVTGVYTDEKMAIYQDSLFPLCYAFAHCRLRREETRITEAVLKCDLKNHDADYYQNEIRKYGDYKGDFPMLLMVQEIQKTMKELSNLFLSFAALSLISSVFLLSLSLYLIIQRDKKNIGILLSLGFRKKEICSYYLVFSEFLGLISFAISLILSLGAEQILKETLQNLMNAYTLSLFPFLISALISVFVTGFVGLTLRLKIQNISPMDAFYKTM